MNINDVKIKNFHCGKHGPVKPVVTPLCLDCLREEAEPREEKKHHIACEFDGCVCKPHPKIEELPTNITGGGWVPDIAEKLNEIIRYINENN